MFTGEGKVILQRGEISVKLHRIVLLLCALHDTHSAHERLEATDRLPRRAVPHTLHAHTGDGTRSGPTPESRGGMEATKHFHHVLVYMLIKTYHQGGGVASAMYRPSSRRRTGM